MNAMLAMLLTSQGHVWNIRVRRAAGKNAKFAERRQRALGITSARNVPRQQLSKKPLHHWCPFPTGGFRGLTEGCSHHELHQMGSNGYILSNRSLCSSIFASDDAKATWIMF